MFGLPKSTEFNKRIPKQKFYDNMPVTQALKRAFVEQIKNIYWANKLAPATLNVAAGSNVNEIEVFHVLLNQAEIDQNILVQIDKAIPYHILYVLEYDGKYKAVVCYKKAVKDGGSKYKVSDYYYSEWVMMDEFLLKITGLNLDVVYESLIREIAGEELGHDSTEDIEVSIERAEKIKKLKKDIEKLEKKIRREKQFNRQVEMNGELKKMKKELEALQQWKK